MSKATDANRIAKAHTPLGDKLLFREMSGREELSRPFEYRLELLAEDDSKVDPKALLGRNITVELEIQGGGSRYIDAECVRFAYVGVETVPGRNTKFWRYEARLRPWTHYMTLASNCRLFQDQTVPDMVRTILEEYPYSVEWRLERSYREWTYCVQYQETDFNFVSRLVEHEGIYYFFEHSNGNHKLVFADHLGAHATLPNYAKIPHLPSDKMVVPDEEYIDSFKMEQQVESGAYATRDYDFEHPSGDLTALTVKTLPYPNGDKEIYDWPGGYVKTKWGAQYATTRIEELQQPKELVTAQSTVRGLAPGYLFTLERCPRRDQNREYLILAVNAFVRNNPYHTGTGRPAEWEFSVVAQPSDTPYRPMRITPKPQVAGPQTAVVVGLKDQPNEEIVCDKHGRVRVQFHWDRYHKYNQESSCWMRVSSGWAGNNWGQMCIPRVGQEVIVDFIDGDPDYPIIVGRVYNGEHMPPWDLPANKTQSGILSRSTGKGSKKNANMIRMEDDKDNEEIHIHAQKNLVTVVENDEIKEVQANRYEHIKKDHIEKIDENMRLLVGGNQDLHIKGEKKETVDADNHVHIKGARKEKVEGGQSLTVNGDQQEQVGQKHAVDAGTEIHLKAGMKVVIEAGMQLSLKAGGSFVDLGPTGVTISGTMVLINSGGSPGDGGGSSPSSPTDAEDADPQGPSEE